MTQKQIDFKTILICSFFLILTTCSMIRFEQYARRTRTRRKTELVK